MKTHLDSFTEEVVRSILLSNDVSEYTIRDVLTSHANKEEKPSFRAFRRNQMELNRKKEETDDVILVVYCCLFDIPFEKTKNVRGCSSDGRALA